MTPTRTASHDGGTLGERIADRAASAIGSWRFIIAQSLAVTAWAVLNSAGWFVWKWDAPPFILLNLMFSVQAAYTGPILLLASNRQAQKDREIAARDDEEIGLLLTLQQEQMEALRELQEVLHGGH